MSIERVPASVGERSAGAERLSWEEICARYPDAWVVLVDIEDKNGSPYAGIVSAVVLTHSKARRDCMLEALPIMKREGIRHCAHFYTGEITAPIIPYRYL
jgi:hypothetical protein